MPNGITSITVECWGGGGAGGGATGNPAAGGGGAGGSYVKRVGFTVVPGTTYTITVGSGATGSTAAGSAGGDSWFGSTATILAKGGNGGALASANSNTAAGAAAISTGNVGFTAPFSYYGGAGGTGGASGASGGGGGGSAGTGSNGNNASGVTGGAAVAGGGAGANGSTTSGNGASATGIGGGGAGGRAGNNSDRSGGNGANGQVLVTWACSNTLTSAASSNNQSICSGNSITNITYSIGGATGATITGLPTGVGSVYNNGLVTISGTPTVTGTYNYSITPTGSCVSAIVNGVITINPGPTVNAGPALSAICKNGTTTGLGGSVGGSATGGTWSDGGIGGTFTPNAATLNATYTPPLNFTGTVTLRLTTTGGACTQISGTKSLTVNAPPAATISYGQASFCNSNTISQAINLTGTTGGVFSAGAGLSIDASTGAILPYLSTVGNYTVTYSIAASGGCNLFSTTTTISIINDANSISYPSLSYCYAATAGTINVTRTAPSGGTYSASPAGLSLDPSTGAVNIGTSSPGLYVVTYTFAGTCSNTVSANLNIYAAPVVVAPSNMGVCTSAGSFQLTGGSPVGGTYSGNGVSGGFFNPSTAGVGTHTITYSYTNASGCSASATYAITVSSSAPTVNALPLSTYVYSGNYATINLNGNVTGTQFTWTATCNNPSITGYLSQSTPVPGPINQQVYNPSTSVGEITYVITPSLIGCTGTPTTIVISMPSSTFCENPGTFQAGSCIIDMGVVPQTYANGLKPYGLVYQLLNIYKVPVYWAVNPNKTFENATAKVDQADFTVDGYTYRGGPFIIPAGYLSQVQSVINSWVAQGVVVRYASTNFSPPYYDLLTRIPKVVLDINTGDLVEAGFYTKAGIPTTAYTKGGIPSAITNCDDIYVLPHADPASWTQAQKDSLLNFINSRGWLFTSCYAVSQIENLPGMNFLSNGGLVAYNAHSHPPTGGAFAYSLSAGLEAASFASDPFMQFAGKFDGAVNTYALERVYVPKPAGWRSTTKIATYYPNYTNTNSGLSYSNTAAELVYGRAFGDANKGIVMYLAGHDFERGSVAENVAMARVYASFLLRSGAGTRPRIVPVSIPATANSGQTISLQVTIPPTTSTIATTEWISDLNGIFSSNNTTTTFTAPTVDVPTVCTIQFKVTDACGRVGLYCTTILINPTITNNYITTAQTICSGTSPNLLSGTVPSGPVGYSPVYQWLVSTTNASSGYTNAPGTGNQQDYASPALTQTSWFRRQVTMNNITVFSTPIQITVSNGPSIVTQPSATSQGVCQGGTFAALSVSATESPVSYQWYSNTSAVNTGGAIIASAVNATYTPSSASQGTLYYYCTITNAAGCSSTSAISGAVNVNASLLITSNPSMTPQNVCAGQSFSPLTVVANGSGLTYQWYRNASQLNTGGTSIPGATGPSYTPPSGTSYYYYVLVGSPSGGCLPAVVRSQVSALMTIKDVPVPSITNNTGTATITCGNREISLTASGGTSYSWNSNAYVTPSILVTDSGTYSVVVTGSNGCTANANIYISWGIVGSTWTGEYSADWDDEENWCGEVPGPNSVVTIPAGTPNDPVISTELASVKDLTILNGAVVYLDGQKLKLYGSLTSVGNVNAVNGTIEICGSVGPQQISGSMFAAKRIQNLRLGNSNGVNLSGANDTLFITGKLDFGANNVVLTTNDNLTIKSDINGTGSIADMTSNGQFSGNRISGNVTVERYIPNHPKAWQFLSTPTVGSTIKSAWQENNTPLANALNPGYGTIITGNFGGSTAGANALGFDIYTPTGPSMKYYDAATNTWIGVPNTTSSIANSKGYMLLVRGDRSVLAYNQAATATTLRTTGNIYQPIGNAPAAINVLADKFESVGNPYAAAIDPSKLIRTGGVQDVYYVWDPKLTSSTYSAYGLGAYQTIVGNGTGYTVVPGGGSYSNGNYNIESGQAFLVKSMATSGSLSFIETSKTDGSNNVNRVWNPTEQVMARLYLDHSSGPILLDGALVVFDTAYNNVIDKLDAVKMQNGSSEAISIYRSNKKLSAEFRNNRFVKDTIFYQVNNLRRLNYRLEIKADRISAQQHTARLVDQYLGTSTILMPDSSMLFPVLVNTDAGSYAPDRFYIVFESKQKHPFGYKNFTAIRNAQRNQEVSLDWTTFNEQDIYKYLIERSTDSIHFETISELPKMNTLYNYKDLNAGKVQLFYRIKAQNVRNDSFITQVIKIPFINDSQSSESYQVTPNPVIGKIIHLKYQVTLRGSYLFELRDVNGKKIKTFVQRLEAGMGMTTFKISELLSSGTYLLQIRKPNDDVETLKIWVE